MFNKIVKKIFVRMIKMLKSTVCFGVPMMPVMSKDVMTIETVPISKWFSRMSANMAYAPHQLTRKTKIEKSTLVSMLEKF